MLKIILILFILIPNILFQQIKLSGEDSEVSLDDSSKVKRSIFEGQIKKWKTNLKFLITKNVTQTSVILNALRKIENETCFNFEQIYSLPPYEQVIEFVDGHVCKTLIGNKHGDEVHYIFIDDACATNYGKIQLLVGSLLGMLSQEFRPNRDEYIKLVYENLNDQFINYLQKYEDKTKYYGLDFDYASLLNYGSTAFSKNGEKTLVPIRSWYENMLGQRIRLVFNDYKLLNLHYCGNQIKGDLKCKNMGYIDPKNKKRCKCPNGFTGVLCEKIRKSDKECGNTKMTTNCTYNDLIIKGKKSCTHEIIAPKGYRIVTFIKSVSTPYQSPCLENMGIEIKYRKDWGVMGLCLCGTYRRYRLVSETNKVLVMYNGTRSDDKVILQFKRILN
uniref:Metalloendopeptidase n=1 Tax=Parastrongyloides trichosuri TaxID=131310 RepID=A0A0N4ZM56_PARTI